MGTIAVNMPALTAEDNFRPKKKKEMLNVTPNKPARISLPRSSLFIPSCGTKNRRIKAATKNLKKAKRKIGETKSTIFITGELTPQIIEAAVTAIKAFPFNEILDSI